MRDLPEIFEVVGWCDPEKCVEYDEFTGKQVIAGIEYKGDTNIYRHLYDGVPEMELEELLNYPGLEAVVIESSEYNLFKYAQMAAERGLHVHMDKPGGLSYADFEKLVEIDKQAKKYDRNIKCLLQIHIAAEDTKFGFSPQECLQMLETTSWQELSNITIAGVMGMATFTDNLQQVKQEFETLVALFNNIKQRYFAESDCFSMISAGMSDDYQLAMDVGSNLVRIGSNIFGARDYSK
ncbi:MAG: alanine racemase [Bacteroidaceae bacterium]|nr:alanine racemase [Bacteroidaceae bacterium]